jgi:hypothetical protein
MGQTENSLDRNGDSRKAGVGRAHTVRPNKSQWHFAEFMRKTMVAYDTVRPMEDLSYIAPKRQFVGLTTEELLWLRAT